MQTLKTDANETSNFKSISHHADFIGSSLLSAYNSNTASINKLAKIDFIDDKEAKPVGIHKTIGRQPVFCAGNSDGDLPIMQYTAANKLKNFQLYVHHTDDKREWKYDRNSSVDVLTKPWMNPLKMAGRLLIWLRTGR